MGHRRARAAAPATLGLLGAAIAATVATARLGPLGDPDVLVRAGALERSHVWAGQWWRLATAALLHGSWMHLAINVVLGGPCCWMVERALGTPGAALVFAAGAIVGSATSLLAQDVVAVGASGAISGAVGALLVLRARHLGGMRALLGDRLTWATAAGVIAWEVVGSLFFPIDHPDHAGGLAAGIAAAWLLTRPRQAPRWPWVPATLALAGLAAAAVLPRDVLTREEARHREQQIHAALRREDRDAARRLLAEAASRGQRSPDLAYYGALLHVQDGDLEGALALVRPLAASGEPGPLRDEATRVARALAKGLGYRYATGDGAEKDPARGAAFLDEACSAGDGESCAWADALRAGVDLVPARPPAPPPPASPPAAR